MSQGVSKCRPELSAWVKLFLSTVEASSIHTRVHTVRHSISVGVPVSDMRLRRPSGGTSKSCPVAFARRKRDHPVTHTQHTHASILSCKWAVTSLTLFTVAEWSKPGSIALKRRTLERFVLQNLDTHRGAHMLSHTLIFGGGNLLGFGQKTGT